MKHKMQWFVLLLTLVVQNAVSQYTDTKEEFYKIAGIFDPNAIVQIQAFNNCMSHVTLEERGLAPTILKPNRTDSYSVWRELCRNEEIRPVAIFGIQSAIADGAIRDQCAKAQIPHLQAVSQPTDPDLELMEDVAEETSEATAPEERRKRATDDGNEEAEESAEPVFKKITINFYPDPNEIAIAYSKLLQYYNWENFAALYEDDFGLMRIQKILAEHTKNYPIFVRKLDPTNPDNNIKVFKELKKYQESRILLDCHVDNIPMYMKTASDMKIVNYYQHYILVSMDSAVHFDKMSIYSANITWLSLTQFEKLNDAQQDLGSRVGAWGTGQGSPPVIKFQLEALLMEDIANHVLKSLRTVEDKYSLDKLEHPDQFICDPEVQPWQHGAALQQAILNISSYGIISGQIQFDENGRRYNYTLYANEIHQHKQRTIGEWHSINGDEININSDLDGDDNAPKSQNLIIISRKAKPFFYDKEKCEGEDCEKVNEEEDDGLEYEGFSVDLVKEIFKQMKDFGRNYTFQFIHDKDKTYGKYDEKEKKWNGLIGDLLDNKADLAVCDLTITEERKKVVDFSVPFMNLGISILYTKDHKIPPDTFSFLNPYSLEVWIYTGVAYFVVSMVLFFCARISPADWENPQPCDKDPEELENIWNFKNCAWLTLGSIMTQGCDILPKALGSRWVCGMWWFFAVIVCQTYIAQLSASMTSAMDMVPINSVEDLAQQSKVLYGAFSSGSTLEFFRKSPDKMYKAMYETMMANDGVLVQSNDEGEQRVLNGKNKYAVFMESTTIDYKIKRDCRLKKVGELLDSKDYGIAMPANSPFRSDINRAILKLKELTLLDKIKERWWDEKYGAMTCESESKENDVEGDLEMENLVGAFYVLIFGLFLCLFITAAEFMDEVRNIVVREQVTHKEALVQELKASLNFFQLQKPVLRNPSRAPSMETLKSPEERQNRRAVALESFIDLEKMGQ